MTLVFPVLLVKIHIKSNHAIIIYACIEYKLNFLQNPIYKILNC